MSKAEVRHHIQRIGAYLCNNVPYTDIEIRKELLQSLAELSMEFGINFAEYCKLLEDKYEVKEPIRN